jgi:NAD(P)-dependent dehydrogenase (short-subunit alcohol dehydrogenase family)
MSAKFSNKVTVVTGGSRGIGREIALEFARSGAQTVIVSSSAENLANAAKTISDGRASASHHCCGFASFGGLSAGFRYCKGQI